MQSSPRVRVLTAVSTAVAGTLLFAPTAAQAASVTVQAESYAAQSGAQVEATADSGGGQNVAYLGNGDWLRYDGVNLGAAGSLTVQARVASATGTGSIELRTGSQTGPVLASFAVANTGGWQAWSTQTTTVASHPTGSQTVFALLKNSTGGDFVNLNWFSFGDGAATDGPGWIPLDQAAWNAQLAQFNALTPKAVPAGTVRVSEFNATCAYSHSRPDDPIIFPGMPGASHMHTFLGNTRTDAATTTQALLSNAGTTCRPSPDLSAYWIPTLYNGDQAIEPKDVVVYYGSRITDPSVTKPFPQGFKMIAGDAKLQTPTPAGSVNAFYCAGPGGEIGRSADGNWPICASTAVLMFHLVFQDCWDGKHLDSPTHKAHVSYSYDGTCKGDYPVAIPNLSFLISYPTQGSANGFRLASGLASSMHGDAFFAWDNLAQSQRVKNCIVQKAKCNTEGNF
ncbi:hypothetical protein GCM10010172_71090 [Paractinoplanes ferrugineus]|uniref:CBM6 domain-containing protein n=1 Tax=Paractinoplanes ferrugineus TaxID=113564 RepID=A0A919J966_9ACTN|nr:DUF1996 domain-containing protein [Actinoplanes ferrugineus]GIE14994.1 hypothetical protein Afe05nite_68340 [Actinoplanes ferrugineus]